jgi:hypothetical protein
VSPNADLKFQNQHMANGVHPWVLKGTKNGAGTFLVFSDLICLVKAMPLHLISVCDPANLN